MADMPIAILKNSPLFIGKSSFSYLHFHSICTKGEKKKRRMTGEEVFRMADMPKAILKNSPLFIGKSFFS